MQANPSSISAAAVSKDGPVLALDGILDSAREAQKLWARLPVAARLKPLAAWRARLAREPLPLAEIVAAETGKTRFEALGAEVLPSAEACAFLLRRAAPLLAVRRETLKGIMPGTGQALVRPVPWGVIGVIVPWNYPLFLAAVPTLQALAAGNAVVLKPSPRAARTVRALAQGLIEAGVPAPLLPVLDASDTTGQALAASKRIDKIMFTGSSRTGRAVLAAAAGNIVPATVELSGYDAVYVLPDADVKLAAAAISFGVRINAGRSCVCPRRVFAARSIVEELAALLKVRLTDSLPAPMDKQTLAELDALAAKLAALPGVQNLNSRQAGDAQRAAVFMVNRNEPDQGANAAFAAAVGNFTPLVLVTPVNDFEDALRLTAQSPYGLGASIFTRDRRLALQLAELLRVGLVAVNECVAPVGEAALPCGGVGESGYGVRGGAEGLLAMTRPQTVALARGTFRPHHVAGAEAEPFLLALLRARHSGTWFQRILGWLLFAKEGIRWRPEQQKGRKGENSND